MLSEEIEEDEDQEFDNDDVLDVDPNENLIDIDFSKHHEDIHYKLKNLLHDAEVAIDNGKILSLFQALN